MFPLVKLLSFYEDDISLKTIDGTDQNSDWFVDS